MIWRIQSEEMNCFPLKTPSFRYKSSNLAASRPLTWMSDEPMKYPSSKAYHSPNSAPIGVKRMFVRKGPEIGTAGAINNDAKVVRGHVVAREFSSRITDKWVMHHRCP
jgi:hypothetical protein